MARSQPGISRAQAIEEVAAEELIMALGGN